MDMREQKEKEQKRAQLLSDAKALAAEKAAGGDMEVRVRACVHVLCHARYMWGHGHARAEREGAKARATAVRCEGVGG